MKAAKGICVPASFSLCRRGTGTWWHKAGPSSAAPAKPTACPGTAAPTRYPAAPPANSWGWSSLWLAQPPRLSQPRGMLSRPGGMLTPLGLLPNGAVPGPIADVQLTARPHHSRTAGAWGAPLTPELHCSLPLGLVHAWKPQLKTF